MKTELDTALGRLIGERSDVSGKEVTAYLGIPYARAGRFGAPVLIDAYDDPVINFGRGVRFPQNDVPPLLNRFLKNPMMRPELLTNADETREDAFVLNIWTTGTETKKPVLVFIHGGGFTYGSGTTPLYNGRRLAARGIVVVTMNYRLGVEGFLPVVREDGSLSANRGFLDQQTALKWVRKHISLFGGDENNITLMGQSAGGLSAFAQFLNPESSALFDRLIVCSAGCPKTVSEGKAREIWERFLRENRLGGLRDLVGAPYKKLLKMRLPLEVASSPVEDGVFFTKPAEVLMERGDYRPMPVMIGSTGDEMKMVDNRSWYKGLGIVRDEKAFAEKCRTVYGAEGAKLMEGLRSGARDLPDLQFKMIEIPMFHASVLEALEQFAGTAQAYGYRMNYAPNAWNGLRGAYHCAELPFIFGTIQDMDYAPSKEI